jgi:thiol-disulfide isomerase/thioredoxin
VRSKQRNLLIVIAALVVVVAAAVIVALVVTGGDDDASDTTAAVEGASGTSLFPGVTISGETLPEFSQQVAQSGDDPAVGMAAPVLSGFDYAGDPETIDPSQDGPTMVVFLAHWCPHCNREVPVLNEWRDSGDVPEGLNVVGVSTAVTADGPNYPPDEWLQRMDWTWPVLADDEASDALHAYGGTGFPTMVFVDGDGTVVQRISGEYPISAIQQYADDLMAS